MSLSPSKAVPPCRGDGAPLVGVQENTTFEGFRRNWMRGLASCVLRTPSRGSQILDMVTLDRAHRGWDPLFPSVKELQPQEVEAVKHPKGLRIHLEPLASNNFSNTPHPPSTPRTGYGPKSGSKKKKKQHHPADRTLPPAPDLGEEDPLSPAVVAAVRAALASLMETQSQPGSRRERTATEKSMASAKSARTANTTKSGKSHHTGRSSIRPPLNTYTGIKPRVTYGRANPDGKSCSAVALWAAARETWPHKMKSYTDEDLANLSKQYQYDIDLLSDAMAIPDTEFISQFTEVCKCTQTIKIVQRYNLTCYLSTEQAEKGFVTMQELVSAAVAPRSARCDQCNTLKQRQDSPVINSCKSTFIIKVMPHTFDALGTRRRRNDILFTYNGKVVNMHSNTYSVTAMICRVAHDDDSEDARDQPNRHHFVCLAPRGENIMLLDDDAPPERIHGEKLRNISKGLCLVFLTRVYNTTLINAATEAGIAVDHSAGPEGITKNQTSTTAEEECYDPNTVTTRSVSRAPSMAKSQSRADSPSPIKEPTSPPTERSRSRANSHPANASLGRKGYGPKQATLENWFNIPPTITTIAPPSAQLVTAKPKKAETPQSILSTLTVHQQNMQSLNTPKATAIRKAGAHILCLQETWAKAGTKIHGYDAFEFIREGKRGGGVCTLIKNTLGITVARLPHAGTKIEAVRLAVYAGSHKFIITNVYITPDSKLTDQDFEHLFPPEDKDTPTIIAGDFNIHIPLYQVTPRDEKNYKELESWIDRNMLDCANTPNTATRITKTSKSAIDYTFSNNGLVNPNSWKSVASVLSDHHAIQYVINLDPDTRVKDGRSYQPRFKWQDADWKKYTDKMETWSQERALRDRRADRSAPQKTWNEFSAAINEAAKASIPFGIPPTISEQIYTKEMATKETAATKAKANWIAHPSEDSKQALDVARESMMKCFAETNGARLAERFSALSPGEGMDWNTLRGLRKLPPHIISAPLSAEHGDKKCINERERANRLARVYARHNKKGASHPKRIRLDKNRTMLIPTVTLEEQRTAIDTCNTNSAPGADGIYAAFLKHLGEEALLLLNRIINHSFRTGFIPESLRSSVIIPLLKPNKPEEDPISYRPVCLTSTLAKVMEKIGTRRLAVHWTPHEYQLAYQEGKGGDDAINTVVQIASHSMNHHVPYQQENKRNTSTTTLHRTSRTIAVMVDMSSAFETVKHDLLMIDLEEQVIPTYLRRWFRNFLRGRTAKTRVGSTLSSLVAMRCGVPQGTVSGPILFLLYVDSLLKTLNNMEGITAIMFADDLTILASGPDKGVVTKLLQPALDILAEWGERKNMAINPSKTQMIMFSKTAGRTAEDKLNSPLYLHGKEIPLTTSSSVEGSKTVKLLGVELDTRVDLNKHLASLANKTVIRTQQLAMIANSKFGAPPSDLRSFHKGYVESSLLHGTSACFGRSDESAYKKVEAVHRKGCRVISGALKSASHNDILLEADCLPLRVTANIRAMSFAIKMRQDHKARLRAPPPCPPPASENRAYNKTHFQTLDDELERLLPHTRIRSKKAVTPLLPLTFFRPRITIGAVLEEGDKLTSSSLALEQHDHIQDMRIATDGSAKVPCRAACVYRIRGGNRLNVTQLCHPLASSFDTEAVAMRNATDLLHITQFLPQPAPLKEAIIISDSQSLLKALEKGPLLQSNPLLKTIWTNLLRVASHDTRIHLQFVNSHVGIKENEEADELAGRDAPPTKPTNELLWDRDAIATIKRALKNEWVTNCGGSSKHRKELIGDMPSPLSSQCMITGKTLSRRQLVSLTRLRTGESTLFGGFYYRIRNQKNECRWCHPLPTLITESANWTSPHPTTKEKALKCKFCGISVANLWDLKKHEEVHHTDNLYHCVYPDCTSSFSSAASRRTHYINCPQNPAAQLRKTEKALKKHKPLEDEMKEVENANHKESISHMMNCPHLKHQRKQYNVDSLHRSETWKFFFSLPFLCWAHSCLDEPLLDEDAFEIPEEPYNPNLLVEFGLWM